MVSAGKKQEKIARNSGEVKLENRFPESRKHF